MVYRVKSEWSFIHMNKFQFLSFLNIIINGGDYEYTEKFDVTQAIIEKGCHH